MCDATRMDSCAMGGRASRWTSRWTWRSHRSISPPESIAWSLTSCRHWHGSMMAWESDYETRHTTSDEECRFGVSWKPLHRKTRTGGATCRALSCLALSINLIHCGDECYNELYMSFE